MAKISSTLCALSVFAAASAFAQTPAAIDPPLAPAAPAAVVPATPEAIDPPIQSPVTQQVIPPVIPDASAMPAASTLPPNATRLNEFQGDEIGLVLRTLARQAGMNIVVSDKVLNADGTVTMRLENKTPREAIEIIVESKGLILDEGRVAFTTSRRTRRRRRSRPRAAATR